MRIVLLFLALTMPAAAQVATVTSANHSATLPQLQRIVENARVDLARLRVDKWKADAAVKQQTAANIESLQRNLSGALPTLVAAAQQNPSSLNASFKLYRNLNALYDVMGNVTEAAGAFGAKDEYAALAQDLNNLETARRAMADAMESMTAQRDAEFARMQHAAQRAQPAAAAPPKKIVIDDNEPVKKPAKKKAAPKQ